MPETSRQGLLDISPREALARAMWAAYPGACWTWDAMTETMREAWFERADYVLRHLQKAGFTIARADARKGKET